MNGGVPLLQATGGDPTVVVLVFVALALASVLSLYLTVRLYSGYRAGGGREMATLGVGLVLLTAVPVHVRLVLSNVPGTGPTVRALAATTCQLVGLVFILGVVYDRR